MSTLWLAQPGELGHGETVRACARAVGSDEGVNFVSFPLIFLLSRIVDRWRIKFRPSFHLQVDHTLNIIYLLQQHSTDVAPN